MHEVPDSVYPAEQEYPVAAARQSSQSKLYEPLPGQVFVVVVVGLVLHDEPVSVPVWQE